MPPRRAGLSRVADEDKLYAWDGAAWVIAGGGSVNPTPLVGVNATADTTNRLSVSSPASLFNHAGAGHQQKINKNAAAEMRIAARDPSRVLSRAMTIILNPKCRGSGSSFPGSA